METQTPKDPNNLSDLEQKHWPQIEAIKPRIGEKFVVRVKVGRVPHMMTPEHLIMYIELFYGNKPVGKKFLKPGDEPQADFTILAEKPDKIIAKEFCNLHGLWINELKIGF